MVIFLRLSDLQAKDIINTKEGKKIGRIIDAEIENNTGKIIYFVVEHKKFLKNIAINGNDSTISYEQINKIGEDVILVDL